jgi:hypothetical protein
MTNRRDFLKNSLLSAGAVGLSTNPAWAKFSAENEKPPMRFIFIHKGNGLFPKAMVPPTFNDELKAKEKSKAPYEASLMDNDLPAWMGALNEHKENMTILQGLSGKMCTVGHHSFQSSLGVYKANQRLSSIKWATVDFELAKLYPSPLDHIELACFPISGGNSRGNLNGIEKGFSARGAQQPNYAFGSPKIAIKKLFKSVSDTKDGQVQYELERKVLEFAAGKQSKLSESLNGIEKSKVANYADSIEAIRKRNKKIDAMGDVIREHAPQLDEKYLADEMSTIDRQVGHTEVLLSTLISGMTNVATFTIDELGTLYTGITDIEKETVNLHDVGHGKSVGAFKAEEVREKVRCHHMDVVDSIVKRLKSVPEGSGNMFDNTTIFYYPDGGETHHSKGTEFPFIVLSGKNSKLNIAGKYIRLPGYGKEGHKTLGNWYTSILNAYGNDIAHFGDPDTGLGHMNQKGPIKEFMTS